MISLSMTPYLRAIRRWIHAPARLTPRNSPTRPLRYRPTFESLESRNLLSASMVEFDIPTANSGALDIAQGPDGNLWFVEQLGQKIGKITPSGAITEYSVSGDPVDIWAGQDGYMWYTLLYANKVGKIDTSTGQVTEYSVPTANAGPNGITLGADGNMWFALYFAGKVASITPDGQITEFTTGGYPTDLALGSDGNVWFTSYNSNQVGKISTSGSVTLYSAPSSSGPAGIAAGSDGNLWVTLYNTGKVAKVTTSGQFTQYSIPSSNSQPWAINSGAAGSLWLAESGSNKIARLSTSGQFTEYAVPTANSSPRGIVAAADGSIWWTEYNGNHIGTFSSPAPVISLSVTYGAGRSVTLSGQVADDDPGGLTVTFTGMVAGTVVTDGNGNFSGTFTAAGLGVVQASTIDPFGLSSNVASVTLVSNAPVISNFMAAAGPQNTWVFTGTVTDESAVGLVVSFGGLPSLAGKTAIVQENGTFVLTVELQANEEGTASAITTDAWGLNSNLALWVVAL